MEGLVVECLLETHLEVGDPPLTSWLSEQLSQLGRLAGAGPGGVTVVVVDDGRMAELHERYHGDASTTDVLSFDLRDESGGGSAIEGDLVLCADEARRQAQRRGHALRVELLLYGLHGLLHLLGYDDHAPAEARRMHQREDELLTQAGFGAVYGTGAPTPETRSTEPPP